MVIEDAPDLASIFESVRSISKNWPSSSGGAPEIWFRGQPKNCSLLPGLYRPNIPQYDEVNLFERFKSRGAAYVDGKIFSEWDWYFLAQHHGLPTRLLDWTENLLAALYFALASQMETCTSDEYEAELVGPLKPAKYDDNSPVIWVLEAGSLNQFSCNDDCVITPSPNGEVTALYLPVRLAAEKTERNRYPLALLPPYRNSRIIVQQGIFTIHGHGRQPIDGLPAPIGLAQIRLDRANLARFWQDLDLAGISRAVLYPDLDSLAFYLKWSCQLSGSPPIDDATA